MQLHHGVVLALAANTVKHKRDTAGEPVKNWARRLKLCNAPCMRRLFNWPHVSTLLLFVYSGCSKSGTDVALSRTVELPDVPVPSADGPFLGATAHATPIHDRPRKDATRIGYLHAGAKVARAVDAYSHEGCEQGWYPVRPRGFVCLDDGATLDMQHPTLATMAIQPDLNAALPYTYARTTRDSRFWTPANAQQRTITADRPVTSRSGAAIVGQWEGTDGEGVTRRLAMLTNGRFFDINDVEEAQTSDFVGVTLGETEKLPVGFIVKRGIGAWDVAGPTFERKRELTYHELIRLTGRVRDVKGQRLWEATDGLWVRHQDMTTIAQRTEVPKFVKPGQRWVDVSIIAGTLVAYEGTEPVFATLVSVGRDRTADDVPDAKVTTRGEFVVTAKYVTALTHDINSFANRVEMHDTPWLLQMSSGQVIHGAFWHNRFGIEHGDGNLQLSPADARWLFQWATPEVPEGWHAVVADGAEAPKADDVVPILPPSDTPTSTIINIRK